MNQLQTMTNDLLVLLTVMSSSSTASKKPDEPLIISDIKKGSMAHR